MQLAEVQGADPTMRPAEVQNAVPTMPSAEIQKAEETMVPADATMVDPTMPPAEVPGLRVPSKAKTYTAISYENQRVVIEFCVDLWSRVLSEYVSFFCHVTSV